MKDIWKARTQNWNKAGSILENFGFVLKQANIEKKESDISENSFKRKISKLSKITIPQEGCIMTLESDTWPNEIKYAGIYLEKNKILNKEYGKIKENTIEELAQKYSNFHKDILDNSKVKIKYYKTEKL